MSSHLCGIADAETGGNSPRFVEIVTRPNPPLICKKIFAPYQVNKKLLQKADRRVIVMHCLPAYRGEEITDEVFEANAEVIFDEAENRLHAQKAIMTLLMS